MKISKERLLKEAAVHGFRPEILEKAFQLLSLLKAFFAHPFLKNRFVLKGGTALNLFIFDLPRLSIDIDLNYIGAVDRETMLSHRPKIEEAIKAVCSREGFTVRRLPADNHAGGKWSLRYESSLGKGGNLALDLNFLFRLPLWPVSSRSILSLNYIEVENIPVLDIHELAAGKITALMSRTAARDLFDVHHLLTKEVLDWERLRLACVIYGAMSRIDWRTVSMNDIHFDQRDLQTMLIPVLRENILKQISPVEDWAKRLIEECRSALSRVYPLRENEMEFLNRLLDKGEIDASLLVSDEGLIERIKNQPGLQWKALNVRNFTGKQIDQED